MKPDRTPSSPGAADAAGEPQPALWSFVPLADYRLPVLPARGAAANAWTAFKRIFRRSGQDGQAPVKSESELHALSQVRLQHLVPPLDWNAAALVLDESLREWREDPAPERPVKFVIGQPHGGHADIVRKWGEMHGAAVIRPPDREQILDADESWFDGWPQAGQLWVLPDLEHCYLRHVRGLSLLRQLLEKAESGRLGHGVIGCDSWAWAYLQRVWTVPRPDALTLQAFDGARLARLFAGMAESRRGGRICFRNATTGNDILTIPPDDDAIRPEIAQLAAYCRGNVGVAVHTWREWLRSEPDADESQPNASTEVLKKRQAGEESVWVSAALAEPALPCESEEDMHLLLHALLLHGGLPEALLPELLPMSRDRAMALLLCLQHGGMVQSRGDDWYVPAAAYPTVRGLLRGQGLLTDDF